MTNSLTRILALPFALILIFAFSSGGLDYSGPKTILILISLVCLMLLYVFNEQINIWWYKRKMLPLERPLKSWIATYSLFYHGLDVVQRDIFERRISTFNKVKSFTLKVEKDYQLEEDVKTIISHEFMRLSLHKEEYLFEGLDHFVVYNHPFGSPDIQALHTLEFQREDKVVILSKEQLVNGFLDPTIYVNISLLVAVMVFIELYPDLDYPNMSNISVKEIVTAHDIQWSALEATMGHDDIDSLELIVFCYFLYPLRTRAYDSDIFEQLEHIFKYTEHK